MPGGGVLPFGCHSFVPDVLTGGGVEPPSYVGGGVEPDVGSPPPPPIAGFCDSGGDATVPFAGASVPGGTFWAGEAFDDIPPPSAGGVAFETAGVGVVGVVVVSSGAGEHPARRRTVTSPRGANGRITASPRPRRSGLACRP